MKEFKNYDDFVKSVRMLIKTNAFPEDNYIVEFTCLEPILKDNIPSHKRLNYVEVCCIDSYNNIIWFDDWYEGYQTSFDIISIISIHEAVKLNSELNKYKKLFDDMSYLSREAYEAIGLLEDKFRVR